MKTICFKTQSGTLYQIRSVDITVTNNAVGIAYGSTTGFIAINMQTNKPAYHDNGVWIFPNEISAKEGIKKWR
jgi:hypothetical protein